MTMLPNDHHPGPRCSCRDCERTYPYPDSSRTQVGALLRDETLEVVENLQRILDRMYECATYQARGLSSDTLQSTNRAELTAIIRQLEARVGRVAQLGAAAGRAPRR